MWSCIVVADTFLNFRFVILKLVPRDLLFQLPVPKRLREYLNTPFYYSEAIADWTDDKPTASSAEAAAAASVTSAADSTADLTAAASASVPSDSEPDDPPSQPGPGLLDRREEPEAGAE
jgi:hypothetical protein